MSKYLKHVDRVLSALVTFGVVYIGLQLLYLENVVEAYRIVCERCQDIEPYKSNFEVRETLIRAGAQEKLLLDGVAYYFLALFVLTWISQAVSQRARSTKD